MPFNPASLASNLWVHHSLMRRPTDVYGCPIPCCASLRPDQWKPAITWLTGRSDLENQQNITAAGAHHCLGPIPKAEFSAGPPPGVLLRQIAKVPEEVIVMAATYKVVEVFVAIRCSRRLL